MTTKTRPRPRRVLLREWEARAFAEGLKTLIVRPAKPPTKGRFLPYDNWRVDPDEPDSAYMDDFGGRLRIYSPFGSPGDELVGCEAWISGYECEDGYLKTVDAEDNEIDETVWYRATEGEFQWWRDGEPLDRVPWRPAATMPAWAARFRWTIAGVEVQQWGDLTFKEMADTGVEWNSGPLRFGHTNPLSAFRSVWDQDFGKRHPVESNPWVWLCRVAAKEA